MKQRVLYKIEEEIHRRLKILAADRKISLSELIEQVLLQYLGKESDAKS